jgi:ligand-binding sensor domain-containing protein/signal transduction histidine kinase/AraC-like DNA-binding protein/ActR/RegA family two-component response regulator
MFVLNFNNLKKIGLFLAGILPSLIVPYQLKAHGLKYHEFSPIDRRLGMDASVVYCVVQDNHGLIWLGTDRGLYSFDGYSARHYSARTQLGKGNDGVVYCAQMVDSIHIWLGADNGLFVFNTYTDRYESAPSGLPENIRAMSRINDHSFWIGSINGLYRYDAVSHKSEKIRDEVLPHPAIYAILRYDENTFYFGTYNGLCRFNTQSGQFDKIPLGKEHMAPNQLILSLLADYSHNCIWVGVEGDLFAYNQSTQQSTAEPLFKGNSVKSLLLDNQNCLWAGTDNGLFIYEPSTGKYRVIRHDALNDRSLVNNVVWTVFTDRKQNIWIGTDAGASLFIYNDRYKVHSISELTGSNEGNQIISILADSKNNLWLGGTNGLIKVDKLNGKTIWYQQNNSQYPLPHNKVRYVFEDADGDVWIATDGSICLYNEKSSQFVRYQIEDITHIRNANWAYAISQDETRKLWIATCFGGLFVVDKKSLLASKGKPFVAERNYFTNSSPTGLSGNMLQFLAFDNDRNMWVGTYRAGINKIDRLNQKVIRFTTQSSDSLPSDDVTAMIIDEDNSLWIALRNRIIKMDPRKHNMKIITDARLNDSYINALADDGKRIWVSLSSGLFFIDKTTLKLKRINSSENYYSSVHYDHYTHRIIAGSTNEYTEFDPETMLVNDEQTNIFITSLWINDKLVQASPYQNLPFKLAQSIRFIKTIELPHNFNNLSLTFSEFNYNEQQSIQYAYKLNSLDPDWHFSARGNNRITYNNLQPGDYTLLISCIGSDGSPVTNPLTLLIKVDPPWYLSTLAKCAYFVIIVLLIMAFVNYYMILNRLRFERLEKAKTMELTAHKIDFLTNISHELKTPLSLIIGPLGKIIEQVKLAAIKNQLASVRQNALKMGSLIHQMMEASRQEFDGFGLIASKTDIVSFMHSVVSVFEKPLKERTIDIIFESNVPSFFIEADILKLEVILNNILSNAAKFSPDNSFINVTLETLPDLVKLSVTDHGPGIDPNDLPHIFERFFQSRHILPQNKEGSGVGLSIVKKYVQLHRGTIKVLSDGKNGTCVEVILPVKHIVGESEYAVSAQTASSPERTDKPLLLIVEDNLEILTFIANSLSNEFRCITAQNGKLGLEAAFSQKPDAIVADIMMPVMDGIEMCRKLKENIMTSPIPVIMLTAKDDKNTELLGYRTGADAFIAKPFEIGYLSDRLRHLLKGRNLLVQKARQEAIIQPGEKKIISTNEKFLATITEIIENEIANPDLNVNVLSEKSGYSPKQVYRRIKSLTGQTAVDYIRSVKLKKAAVLLSRKTFTVAEVMYMVGFTNHSYFAKRFQEMFGKSPKQYTEGETNVHSVSKNK